MASFSSSSLRIITVLLAVAPSGVGAAMSAKPTQPLAVTPPASPEALSEWSEELVDAAEGVQQRCGQVASDLRDIETIKTAPEFAKFRDVLGDLRDLESPARRVLASIRAAAALMRKDTCTEQAPVENDGTCTEHTDIEKGLAALPGVRDRFLFCLLGVVARARGLMRLDGEKKEWAAVEALAIEEAEADPNNPDLQFGLGLYWSDVALASGEAAGSSDAWWVRDSGGANAPSLIVRAETLLQSSQVATDIPLERRNRAAIRAHRLYQHADFMARKQHDAAAVWRYRSAAELASHSQRSRMSVHGLEMKALTRLAYFLDRGGKDAEALVAVTTALELRHSFDASRLPLAKFLQTTLRRRLGHLGTHMDVLDAEQQLLAVAGRLPSPTLESERAEAHAEFVAWRTVAEAPAWSSERFNKCFGLGDAARTMVCMLCSVVFS